MTPLFWLSPARRQFCYICLGPWSEHTSRPGFSYYKCRDRSAQESNLETIQKVKAAGGGGGGVTRKSQLEIKKEALVEKYQTHQQSWEMEQPYLGEAIRKAVQFSLDGDDAGAGGGRGEVNWLVAGFDALAEGRRLLGCSCAWLHMRLDHELTLRGHGHGMRSSSSSSSSSSSAGSAERALVDLTFEVEKLSGMIAKRFLDSSKDSIQVRERRALHACACADAATRSTNLLAKT
jgi:hypothetical protein